MKAVRKTKAINDNAKELANQLKELEAQAIIAREEEENTVNTLKENINNLCVEKDMFCGVILTPDDIATIVKLAIDTRENIKIPFNLYFND